MERNYLRDIYVFGSDFWSFYHLQPNKIQDKFDWVIDLGLFCFFDRDLVILLNGFQKKSQKTPTREILKAKRLRRQYYEEKRK